MKYVYFSLFLISFLVLIYVEVIKIHISKSINIAIFRLMHSHKCKL